MKRKTLLDFDQKLQELAQSKDGVIVGYVFVSTPIKVFNIEYYRTNNDAYFALYQAIVGLLELDNSISTKAMSALLGSAESFIKKIVKDLISDGCLIRDELTQQVSVTNRGRDIYLDDARGARKERVTNSIILDGTTLELLPKEFYDLDDRLSIKERYSDFPARPLMQDDPVIQETLDYIQQSIDDNDFDYALGEGVEDIVYHSSDDRALRGPMILFVSTRTQGLKKILCLRGQETEIPTMRDKMQRYYFVLKDGSLNHNSGISRNSDVAKSAYYFSRKDLAAFLSTRYSLQGDRWNSDIKDLTGLEPLMITEEMFDNSRNRQLILADIKDRCIKLQMSSKAGELFIEVTASDVLFKASDINDQILEWEANHRNQAFTKQDLQFILSIYKETDWRYWLIKFQRMDILEYIDRSEHFKYTSI